MPWKKLVKIKGEDGKTPIAGVDFEIPKNGSDGIDGVDGKDGRDGEDGVDGRDGKDGKDGIDGKNPEPKEIISELKKLSGNDRLDISNIRNGENLLLAIKKSKESQMIHGGGISDIRDEGVKILNISALDFIGAGVTLSYQADGVVVVSIPGSGGAQVNNETPGGAIDSNNTAFTLAHTPINTSLMLYLNGQLLTVTEDYTRVGVNLTLINAPMTGGVLRAFYQY